MAAFTAVSASQSVVEAMQSALPHLELFYKGQEQVALQAALIQGIWSPVGGADQHQAILPEPGEQPVQNSSICHIIYEEFIQAEDLPLASDCICNLHQRVLAAVVLLETGVHVQHEVVEVRALQLQAQHQAHHLFVGKDKQPTRCPGQQTSLGVKVPFKWA